MLTLLFNFPFWWYRQVPSHFPYLLRNLTLLLEDGFAIGLMLRLLFVPLFHDTTVWGRILSFLFRLIRVIAGSLFILLADIFLLLVFAFWLIFPLYLLLGFGLYGFLPLAIIFWVYYSSRKDKSLKKIADFKGKINLWQVLTPQAAKILKESKSCYSLLNNLLSQPEFSRVTGKMGLSPKTCLEAVKKNAAKLQGDLDKNQILTLAYQQALSLNFPYIDWEHLFLALVEKEKTLAEIFKQFDLGKEEIKESILWYDEGILSLKSPRLWDPDFIFAPLGGVNRDWIGNITPTLDSCGRDLTAESQKGNLPPVLERKDLVSQVVLILSRSRENNVILVGEAGAGKTALVYSLAQRIITGGAPAPLRFKRVVALEPASLLAGTKTEGDLSLKMKKIIEELEFTENVILFIDEIQNLVGPAASGRSSVIYGALEPHLTSAKFQVITTASFENYHAVLEKNEEVANLFQKVEVPEASFEETFKILKIWAPIFEQRQKVTISFSALTSTITLSRQYIHDRVLPDKALSLLDEAAVLVATKRPQGIVTKEDVAQIVAQKTRVPVTQITQKEAEKLLHLEEKLHERVIDQEEAILAIANALRRARVGLKEEKRPIGALLFAGPTGVGKTELSKALAEAYFGSEETMIRLDMSEFQTKESIASLIGPPPGYEGAQAGGRLTEAVRQKPFSLILLDEIEKAHPDILNLFLQMIEEARLTDSLGQTVDFANTIIIATSNAATPFIEEELKKGTEIGVIGEKLMEVLQKTFRIEFLNRFDGIILCKPLKIEEVEEVAKLMLKKIIGSLAKKGIEVKISPQLLYKLAERGYQPGLGARPLRRLIQDTVEAKIAKEILTGTLKKGTTVILGEEILERTDK